MNTRITGVWIISYDAIQAAVEMHEYPYYGCLNSLPIGYNEGTRQHEYPYYGCLDTEQLDKYAHICKAWIPLLRVFEYFMLMLDSVLVVGMNTRITGVWIQNNSLTKYAFTRYKYPYYGYLNTKPFSHLHNHALDMNTRITGVWIILNSDRIMARDKREYPYYECLSTNSS